MANQNVHKLIPALVALGASVGLIGGCAPRPANVREMAVAQDQVKLPPSDVLGFLQRVRARDHRADLDLPAVLMDTFSLRGLNGVGVEVEQVGKEAEDRGLGRDLIQTAAELRLRQAGIRVLTRTESLRAPVEGAPFVYVRVTAFDPAGTGLITCVVGVSLRQNVYLEVSGAKYYRSSHLGSE